ncbi:MAG: DNA polymerase III subunit gamma/tau [Cyanobacteriota bacterium]|nr:DNA polymerase III subunit gamma/tau [Cyanobacteriota bacterium]
MCRSDAASKAPQAPKPIVSYEPLHHKYRPAIFADLVGQEAIAKTLTNALQQQKIAPAYLFAGPRGTGKTSSARILAKSLNCLSFDRPTESPCGTCEACHSIARGNALDTIEIDAASNTGVDNIRELIERAQFAPVQCRYKLYIIDECHMLSTAAFNSLLKTLEEPPARVVFVLATTDPQRVLPTIISRCQRFDFRRIPLDAMVAHLQEIARREEIDIDAEAIALVAQIAQGGLRDAESLLDQLGLSADRITIDRVWDLVGAVPERDLMSLLEAIDSDAPQTVIECARHLMDRGREPLVVLQNLAGFYRDLLMAKTASDRPHLAALTPPTWDALCRFSDRWDVAAILAGGQHLRACEAQLKNTTQPRLWLEVSLLGLLPSALHPQFTSESLRSPQTLQSPPVAHPTPVPAPAPSYHPTPAPTPPPVAHQPPAPAPAPSYHPTPAPTSPPIAHQPPAPTPPPISPNPDPPAQVAPEPPPAPAPIPEPTPTDAIDSPTAPDAAQIWPQILDNIQMRATRELLRQQGQFLGLENAAARICVSSGLVKVATSKLSDIEAAFKRTLGRSIVVKIEPLGTTAPTPTPPAPAPARTVPREVPAAPLEAPHPVAQIDRPPPPPDPISTPPISELPPSQSASSPIETPAPMQDWEEDEVTLAAQQLAQFFQGEVTAIGDDPEF